MDKIGKKTLAIMEKAKFYNSWLLNQLKPYINGDILEVGAGIGTFSKGFAKLGNLTAIDINKSYLRKLKKNTTFDSGFGDIEKGKYFFGQRSFDTAVSLNVYEHIDNDQKAIKNTFNLLKKNGKFVLLVPAHQALYGDMDKALGHYRRYGEKELSEKLIAAGFKIKEARYLNWLAAVGWFISGKILKKKIIPQGQLGVFDKLLTPALFLEKIIKPPFGLSLLIVGEKLK